MKNFPKFLNLGIALAVVATSFHLVAEKLTVPPSYALSSDRSAEVRRDPAKPSDLPVILLKTEAAKEGESLRYGCATTPSGPITSPLEVIPNSDDNYYELGESGKKITPLPGTEAKETLATICRSAVASFNADYAARAENQKEAMKAHGGELFGLFIGNTDFASRFPPLPDNTRQFNERERGESASVSFKGTAPDGGLFEINYDQEAATQKPQMVQSAFDGLGQVPKSAQILLTHKGRDRTVISVSGNQISIFDSRSFDTDGDLLFWTTLKKKEGAEVWESSAIRQTRPLPGAPFSIDDEVTVPVPYTREDMLAMARFATGHVAKMASCIPSLPTSKAAPATGLPTPAAP